MDDDCDFLNLPGMWHLAEAIFEHLDDKSLANCRLVNKNWSKTITDLKCYQVRKLSRKTGLVFKPMATKEVLLLLEEYTSVARTMLTLDFVNHVARGYTPLHYYAQKQDFKNFRRVFDIVQTRNPKDNLGWTPLHIAASKGDVKICSYILAHVVDKFPATSLTRDTPYALALLNGHRKVSRLFEHDDYFRFS